MSSRSSTSSIRAAADLMVLVLHIVSYRLRSDRSRSCCAEHWLLVRCRPTRLPTIVPEMQGCLPEALPRVSELQQPMRWLFISYHINYDQIEVDPVAPSIGCSIGVGRHGEPVLYPKCWDVFQKLYLEYPSCSRSDGASYRIISITIR
jgi:hypothetical protein